MPVGESCTDCSLDGRLKHPYRRSEAEVSHLRLRERARAVVVTTLSWLAGSTLALALLGVWLWWRARWWGR